MRRKTYLCQFCQGTVKFTAYLLIHVLGERESLLAPPASLLK